MMSDKYIGRVILKKRVNARSYLADLPAVKYLANHESLEINRDVTFLWEKTGRENPQ